MIHPQIIDLQRLRSLNISNWWGINLTDLARAAPPICDGFDDAIVRSGDVFALISNRKLGSVAHKISAEMTALAAEAQKVLKINDPDAILRAAAAYHVRFENIHPLVQGNGRVGRTILAGQLHQSLDIRPDEFLGALNAQEMDYVATFVNNKPEIMFELLLDLLAQLTGQVIAPESNKLPFSVLPLYPDRRPIIKGAQPQIRLPQKNNYFRQFG
jgi:hypothetical protein